MHDPLCRKGACHLAVDYLPVVPAPSPACSERSLIDYAHKRHSHTRKIKVSLVYNIARAAMSVHMSEEAAEADDAQPKKQGTAGRGSRGSRRSTADEHVARVMRRFRCSRPRLLPVELGYSLSQLGIINLPNAEQTTQCHTARSIYNKMTSHAASAACARTTITKRHRACTLKTEERR